MNSFFNKGLTLVELMVVIVITIIIMGIAIPTYKSFLVASRRHDAILAMRNIQLTVEAYRERNGIYPTSSDVTISTTSEGGFYTITYTRQSTSRYTIAATAVAGTSQASDTGCTTMNLVPEMDDVYPTTCR